MVIKPSKYCQSRFAASSSPFTPKSEDIANTADRLIQSSIDAFVSRKI